MTAPKPMTRRELIELAALDALGLLDDYETSLYTRSFHYAPAAVQDEILELQAKITTDPVLLTDEEPAPDLRERVLEYVNREIESSSDLQPLATIGRRGEAIAATTAIVPHDGSEIAGRIGYTTALWRVAVFVLCGVVIVMAYFLSDSINKQHTLARVALSNNTDARLEQMIGPTVKDYIFSQASTRIVLFSPDAPNVGRAVLFLYEGDTEALLVMDLPRSDGNAYELTVRDANGVTQRIARFASEGGVSGMKIIASTAAFTAGSTWQINGPDGFLLVSA